MNKVSQTNGIFSETAFTRPSNGSSLSGAILIVGGSTAAYSATLAALSMNVDVCLVQPLKIRRRTIYHARTARLR